MVKDTVLYDRLNVKSDASDEEINKAFKLLARKFHPDKHTEENKEEMTAKFQEILQAKEVLLDSERKNLYNQVGMDLFKNNMDQQHNSQPDINAFFQQFQSQFNPFGGSPFGNMQQEPKEDVVKRIDVTLNQLYMQESVSVVYEYKSICAPCNGEGTKNGKSCVCVQCKGRGMVVQIIQMGHTIQQMQTPCNVCKGKGKVVEHSNQCSTCSGKSFSMKEKTIQVPLKSNLTTNTKIRLANKGHQLKNMRTDLIIVINELPHPLFRRVNDDLIMSLELKLYQALFGFDKAIDHLDGEKLYISSSVKTEFNKIGKVVGRGMKNDGKSGDLYIRFLINIPNLLQLTPEMKQQYKTLFMSFDKSEATLEMSVVKERHNHPVSSVSDCKEKESHTVRQIIAQSQEPEREREEEQHGPQCVHQ